MKLAIASSGTSWESQVDRHFGRAGYFVLVDSESRLFRVCGNSTGRQTPYTAGMQAAGALMSLGVEAVIAANIGPKALATFRTAEIPVYRFQGGSIRQAIHRFERGKLPALEEASVCEHYAHRHAQGSSGSEGAATGL